jgi:chemotaxis signal transduction protein
MQHYSASDEAKIIARAKQGDPDAIAAMMNYFFNSQGIQVTVTWKPNVLLILLEAAQTPTQEETVSPIKRAIKLLGLEQIQEIWIYARQQGATSLVWQTKIDLNHQQATINPLALISWLNQGGKESSYLASSPITEPEQSIRFLRFYLNQQDTALVALDDIQSIFRIAPQQILPVPNLANHVLGIYHYRGTLVWLIDFSQQIGFDSCLSLCGASGVLTAIAIPTNQDLFAIVVPRIATIETHEAKMLHPADSALFPSRLLPFISTYVTNSASPVLSPQMVLQQI